jgi:tetratricopeptide (TPR) repeat protein
MIRNQEVFWLLGAGLVFLYHLVRMATENQPADWENITFPTGQSKLNPALQLYQTAETLYDEEDYKAAAAAARLLTSDVHNIALSANASLIVALCHFKLSEFDEAADAATDGLELMRQRAERDTPELNYLELSLILLLWSVTDQDETTKCGLLWQAREILESRVLDFESDYQRNLWSATIYHNLAVAEEWLGKLDEATENYDRARSFWSTFPQDSPHFARRFNESIAGYIDCGRRQLSRLYELNVDEPDGL